MEVICNNKVFKIKNSGLLKEYYDADNKIPKINDMYYDALVNLNVKVKTIEKMIERYNLYHFLDVGKNEKYDLADTMLPLILRSSKKYDINVILEDFPILYKYPKYKNDEISGTIDIVKHCIPHYHYNIKSFKLKEYIKAGNEVMLRHLLKVDNMYEILDYILEFMNIELVDIYLNSLSKLGMLKTQIINSIVICFGADLIYRKDMKNHIIDMLPSCILLKDIDCLKYVFGFDIPDIKLVKSLEFSIMKGFNEIVEYIILEKQLIKNVNLYDVLIVSIESRNIVAIKLLLDNFTKVDYGDSRIIDTAIIVGNMEILEFLILKRFKINNSVKNTPIKRIILRGDLDMLKLILRNNIVTQEVIKYGMGLSRELEYDEIYDELKNFLY